MALGWGQLQEFLSPTGCQERELHGLIKARERYPGAHSCQSLVEPWESAKRGGVRVEAGRGTSTRNHQTPGFLMSLKQ